MEEATDFSVQFDSRIDFASANRSCISVWAPLVSGTTGVAVSDPRTPLFRSSQFLSS